KSDTILISRPLYHCAVLTGEFIVSLIKGVKIRFCSESFNAAAILRLISDYSVTVFGSTPTLMRILARFSKRYKMQSLKKIVISGECMRTASANEIKDAFKDCDIYHVYGLTEAGPRVCFLPPRMFDIAPDSVGIPLSSVSVKIIREDGETANEYENGILYVKGKNIMLGYYNDQEMTGRVLKNGWLCTGDIAYKDEYGLIRIVGRNDDMIIRAGMNIYPQEIEEILKSDVRTKEVMVCGDASRETETKIAMKISGNFKDENEVREMCVRLLAPYQIPDIIEIVAEIPKNGSGKIIRGKAHVGI
ncbi:MAG: class I adenylate-forming enzyme family protein, partial [Acutalibacteraceae bacterium]